MAGRWSAIAAQGAAADGRCAGVGGGETLALTGGG